MAIYPPHLAKCKTKLTVDSHVCAYCSTHCRTQCTICSYRRRDVAYRSRGL